jgi:hypothetical protein
MVNQPLTGDVTTALRNREADLDIPTHKDIPYQGDLVIARSEGEEKTVLRIRAGGHPSAIKLHQVISFGTMRHRLM